MAGKWSRAKAAKAEAEAEAVETEEEVTEVEDTEEVTGMVPATEKYKGRGSGKKSYKRSEKTDNKKKRSSGKPATTTRAAKTSPLPKAGEAGTKSPAEPEEKAAAKRPAEPEKKAAKQPPAKPERKPEPTKAPENGAKQQPDKKAEVGSLVWFGQVDECIQLLTQKSLSHDKVLDDHEWRIHALEQKEEESKGLAQKLLAYTAEAMCNEDLTEERLTEMGEDITSLLVHRYELEDEPVEKPARADEDDDVNTVDDLVGMEAASEAVASKPKLNSNTVPSPAEPATKPASVAEIKPVADVASGKPRRGYRYWDVETKSFFLTLDIWEAKAADDAYQPIWVWVVDDEIDHIMSSWEVRKYRPGTKADK